MLGNHPHSLFPEHFITHGGHPMATKQLLPQSPDSQPLATTNLLSRWICLFWTFQRNGMLHYAAFCDWLLSHSMFPRFIHVAGCIRTSPLSTAERHTVYPVTCGWAAGLLPPFSSYEHVCTSFCIDVFSLLLGLYLQWTCWVTQELHV